MPRWTQTWISGLGAAGIDRHGPGEHQGSRFGLPADGPGSVASFGTRAVAFVVDIAFSGLIAGLVNVVVVQPSDTARSLAGTAVFAVMTVLGLVLLGQTPGMWLFKLRVRVLGDPRPAVGLAPAALRTALLLLLVPALITDRDGRGLHDRAARTVVVRV